jgi:ADP-ribosylglycohydrolase
MKKWGKKYPDAGYGEKFNQWLKSKNSEPYNSCGNGSAMRVSSVGWLYDSLERTCEVAKITAEVTHNHPEGIKGAEAVASVIYLARTGSPKKVIAEHITQKFGYNINKTCESIRAHYVGNMTCQGTVPEAIVAFLEGESFEDVIRLAVSLGGDCDTLTCIAGSMAEAFYGVPDWLSVECENRIKKDMLKVLRKFNVMRQLE